MDNESKFDSLLMGRRKLKKYVLVITSAVPVCCVINTQTNYCLTAPCGTFIKQTHFLYRELLLLYPDLAKVTDENLNPDCRGALYQSDNQTEMLHKSMAFNSLMTWCVSGEGFGFDMQAFDCHSKLYLTFLQLVKILEY